LLVDHPDAPAVELKNVVVTPLFYNPIGVDWGNSHGFTKLLLCQGHLESGTVADEAQGAFGGRREIMIQYLEAGSGTFKPPRSN
jgi:hypothetical protein